jgi:hypothetical protein
MTWLQNTKMVELCAQLEAELDSSQAQLLFCEDWIRTGIKLVLLVVLMLHGCRVLLAMQIQVCSLSLSHSRMAHGRNLVLGDACAESLTIVPTGVLTFKYL